MLKLAGDGIASFSSKPLKIATGVGIVLSVLAAAYLIAAICLAAAGTIPAWNIAAAALFLLNGLLFIALGMLGTYMGRIYEEAKGRPLYIVRDKMGFEKDDQT
jgi:dolichol-phosphate mannosyltransferase